MKVSDAEWQWDKKKLTVYFTAEDLQELGVIDEIIPEPPGGAHADPEAAAEALGETLRRHVRQLRKIKIDKLLKRREEKYLSMGALSEK